MPGSLPRAGDVAVNEEDRSPALLELSALSEEDYRGTYGAKGPLPAPTWPGSPVPLCPAHTTTPRRALHAPRLRRECLPLGPLSHSLLRCQLPLLSARIPLLCCSIWDWYPPLGARKGQGLDLPSLPPSSQGLLTLGPQEMSGGKQTGRWTDRQMDKEPRQGHTARRQGDDLPGVSWCLE